MLSLQFTGIGYLLRLNIIKMIVSKSKFKNELVNKDNVTYLSVTYEDKGVSNCFMRDEW